MTFEKPYRQEGTTGMYQSLLWCLAVAGSSSGYVGESWGEFYTYFKKNFMGVLWDESGMERVARKVIRLSEHGIPPEWDAAWTRIDAMLTHEAHAIAQLDLSAMSLAELRAAYDRMFALDQEMWAISIFIDTFDPGFDRTEIERLQQMHGLTDHELQVLLTPREPSYLSEWGHALTQLRAGTLLRSDLHDRFFWFATNYSSFSELTDVFIENSVGHTEDDIFVSPEEEERTILAAHGLNENPLAFFRSLTTWRDARKRLNYTGIYGLVRILREVMLRHSIDTVLVNGIRIDQIDALFAGQLSEEAVRSQCEDSILLHVTADGRFEFTYGSEAKLLWDSLVAAESTDVSELKGMIASKGKATGTVRVVLEAHHESAQAMQAGDILITSMTRPEFVPLMKLAGAIVTNEGGITSHAAIVSRELKKPCIIGTKIATQVFKDGDVVEVDAFSGIVRKI